MAGFNPVGSRPIGSIGSSDLPGTYLQPAVGDLVLSGVQGALIGVSPVNVYETARETLQSVAGAGVAIDQGSLSREAFLAVESEFRSYGITREAMMQLLSELHMGSLTRETLEAFAPGTVRGHLVVRETLIGTTTGTGAYNASVSIIW